MVSSASIRTVRGMRQATITSQFLAEIPDEHCERHDFTDRWDDGDDDYWDWRNDDGDDDYWDDDFG